MSRPQMNWGWEAKGTLLGGMAGILFAAASEFTHHSAWGILLLLACAVLPTFLVVQVEGQQPTLVRRLLGWCYLQPRHVGTIFVLLLTAINILAKYGLDRNGITNSYLAFVPAVLISGILFGAGLGLVALVLSVAAIDLFLPAARADFFLMEWRSIAILVSFAVLGGALGLVVSVYLSIAQEESDTWTCEHER